MSIRQETTASSSGDNRSVKTLRLAIDPGHLETREAQEALDRAADILRDGRLVASAAQEGLVRMRKDA